MFTAFTRPDNLPDAIARQIREKIVAGDFKQGEKLPTEYELSGIFRVSRNVVREAVARLKLNGFIETRRGVGSFVAADVNARKFEMFGEDLLDIRQFRHACELRQEVEAGAAGLAALHRTEEQLAALRDAQAAMNNAFGDRKQSAEAAFQFHMSIVRSSNNPYYLRLMEHLCYVIRQAVTMHQTQAVDYKYIERIGAEHDLIVDAIARQDELQARQAVRDHLCSSVVTGMLFV